WVHVFECLLRARALDALDLRSMLYRPPFDVEHHWSILARRRMRADYLRLTQPEPADDLGREYQDLIEAYDRAGMPYERALTRLGYARWLGARAYPEAEAVYDTTLHIAQRYGMQLIARHVT